MTKNFFSTKDGPVLDSIQDCWSAYLFNLIQANNAILPYFMVRFKTIKAE
jgi:hypothetical protein